MNASWTANQRRYGSSTSLYLYLELGVAGIALARLLLTWVYHVTTGYHLDVVLYALWIGIYILRTGGFNTAFQAFFSPPHQGVLLLAWGMVLLTNHLLGRGPGTGKHVFSLTYVFAFFLLAKVYARDAWPVFRWLLLLTFVLLGVQSAYSVPHLIQHDRAARMLTQLVEGVDRAQFVKHGIGGYPKYLAEAILLPVMWCFAAYARTRVMRAALLGCCSAILLAILLSTFMAAAIIALVGSALALGFIVAGMRQGEHVRIVVMILLIGGSASGLFFQTMIDTPQFQYIKGKAERLVAGTAESGIVEGEPSGRGTRSARSFKTWMDNPVFGIGGYAGTYAGGKWLGGHSSWIDTLGQYGLVVGGTFGLLLLSIGNRIVQVRRRVHGAKLLMSGCMISFGAYMVAGLVDNVLFMNFFDFALLFVILGAADNAPRLISCNVPIAADMRIAPLQRHPPARVRNRHTNG